MQQESAYGEGIYQPWLHPYAIVWMSFCLFCWWDFCGLFNDLHTDETRRTQNCVSGTAFLALYSLYLCSSKPLHKSEERPLNKGWSYIKLWTHRLSQAVFRHIHWVRLETTKMIEVCLLELKCNGPDNYRNLIWSDRKMSENESWRPTISSLSIWYAKLIVKKWNVCFVAMKATYSIQMFTKMQVAFQLTKLWLPLFHLAFTI